MSLVERAKDELNRAKFGNDSRILVGILEIFFGTWDSGGAVHVMSDVLARLIAGKPLTPLTGADDEWIAQPGATERVVFQNIRCSSVFKDMHGNAYDIDDHRNPVTFPYYPRSSKVPQPWVEISFDDTPSQARTPTPGPHVVRDVQAPDAPRDENKQR